jgi:hypothetical protein
LLYYSLPVGTTLVDTGVNTLSIGPNVTLERGQKHYYYYLFSSFSNFGKGLARFVVEEDYGLVSGGCTKQ